MIIEYENDPPFVVETAADVLGLYIAQGGAVYAMVRGTPNTPGLMAHQCIARCRGDIHYDQRISLSKPGRWLVLPAQADWASEAEKVLAAAGF